MTRTNLQSSRCLSLACGALFVAASAAQPATEFDERLKLVKTEYDYAAWGRDTGRVIAGVPISAAVLPRLKSMTRAWPTDNYDLEHMGQETLTKVRTRWRQADGDDFDATMVVARSFDAAKEYLIRRYAETQREPPLIRPVGRKYALQTGNVCFVIPLERGEGFSSIDFIRDNVVFMLRADGAMRKELANVAAALDAQLLKQKPASRYEQLAERPTIKAFGIAKPRVELGEKAPLILDVAQPGDRQLHYLWTMTAGGIEDDLLGGFVYYAGELGKHQITVTVVNDVGLYASKSATVEVVSR